MSHCATWDLERSDEQEDQSSGRRHRLKSLKWKKCCDLRARIFWVVWPVKLPQTVPQDNRKTKKKSYPDHLTLISAKIRRGDAWFWAKTWKFENLDVLCLSCFYGFGSFSIVVSSSAKAWETTQEPLSSSTYPHPGRQQFASADGSDETHWCYFWFESII